MAIRAAVFLLVIAIVQLSRGQQQVSPNGGRKPQTGNKNPPIDEPKNTCQEYYKSFSGTGINFNRIFVCLGL